MRRSIDPSAVRSYVNGTDNQIILMPTGDYSLDIGFACSFHHVTQPGVHGFTTKTTSNGFHGNNQHSAALYHHPSGSDAKFVFTIRFVVTK